MLIFPFDPPAGFKWVLTREYTDPATNRTTRAADYNQASFCLLVAIGSTVD